MFSAFLSFLLAGIPVLTGRIADLQGKPLAGVSVRAQMEDGRTINGLTDGRGAFRIEAGGKFYLEFRQDGYRTVRTSTLSLPGGDDDVYQADEIRLLPGGPDDAETVVLELEQTANPESRADAAILQALPKADRLFGLRGGVNVTNIREGTGQQWFAASGDAFASSSISTSIAEVSDFSADLANAASVNDALPAGGDAFHGSAYYFHRNDALNAKNFFDPANTPIPPFKYHFFGAEGGAAVRSDTHFYGEYWGLQIRQSITRAATTPDPALLTGDFSSLPTPIIDPDTGFPFLGNRIPVSRLNPEGLAFARLYPAPNTPGAIQNYRAAAELRTDAASAGLRVDHRLTSADEVFVEYQFNRDATDDPFNLLSGITNVPSFGVHDALQTHTVRFSDAHVFSPAVIDQTRFSWMDLHQPRTVLGRATDPLPAILITGFSNLGDAANLPQQRRSRSFEVRNDASWQRGASAWKFGGAFRYLPIDGSIDLYSRGQYQFTGSVFSGNALANMLLGLPTNALRITGATDRSFRTWTMGFYTQHERRLSSTMSMYAGLRYDYQSPYRELNRMASNFDAETGRLIASPKALYEPDRNNFGPRIGIAWRPLPNWVGRAGYGVFYDTIAAGDSVFLLGLNPPFVEFNVRDNGAVVPEFNLQTAFDDSASSPHPSIFSTSRRMTNPYLQQWSASVEYSIRPLVIAVSYFGQKGTNLRRQLNLNQPSAGPAGLVDERRPFPQFQNIFQFETSASSIAHAAEVRAERRFSSGFGFTASYRFARSIDDATLISILPQDSHNLKAERGLSDFHVKHRIVFSGAYNLPGRFSVLKGWELQATGTLQSGAPLSAIIGADVSGVGSPIVNRPDLASSPVVSNPSPSRFFNPDAFRIPPPGEFGNSGRNVIIGPGIRNIDAALMRTIRISDVIRSQVRADFYNVFNHPNFVAPPSMQNLADSPDFGALFVARSPRIVQLGLKFLW